MRTENLELRNLPGQNPLFLAFLDDYERVREFYNPLPTSGEAWKQRAEAVLARPHFDRKALLEVLVATNARIKGGEPTRRHLERLAHPETVVVVTGQQAGLLGGPGYSVYKAVTAIRLVRRLEEQGIPAVPVFWLASDDSDFDEVRNTVLLSRTGGLLRVSHPDRRNQDRQMAGSVPVLPHDEWLVPHLPVLPDDSTYAGLVEDYAAGSSFRDAFGKWIQRLFKNYGLILFDPLEEGYRPGLRDFFRIAVERREELVAASMARKARLRESGFNPQVKIDETESFLFLVEGYERAKLEFVRGEYRAKGKPRFRRSPQELAEGIAEGSLRVGPNVLLRPLMQDYLFPTVVGVVGPSEVAYSSQVMAISSFWGQAPVVWPRVGFTLVDAKSRRLLSRHGLAPADLIGRSPEHLMDRVLRTDGEGAALNAMDTLRQTVEEHADHLRLRLLEEDLTVAEMLEKSLRKVRFQLEKVRGRYLLNRGFRNEYRRNHVEHLLNHLYPDGHLQERVLGFASLLHEGGLALLDRLVEEADPDCHAHRVVYL